MDFVSVIKYVEGMHLAMGNLVLAAIFKWCPRQIQRWPGSKKNCIYLFIYYIPSFAFLF